MVMLRHARRTSPIRKPRTTPVCQVSLRHQDAWISNSDEARLIDSEQLGDAMSCIAGTWVILTRSRTILFGLHRLWAVLLLVIVLILFGV